MMSILANGFLTGLLLQLAVGPVFFFVLNVTLQRSVIDGLCAVLAVAFVDYIYISLAILGIGKLFEQPRVKKPLGVFGSAVLMLFGIMMIVSSIRTTGPVDGIAVMSAPGHLSSFLSAFILTISSPLTIIFWTGLFAAKTIEKDYTRQQIVLFGIAAGFATLAFLGSTILIFSSIKAVIPALLVKLLNAIVGGLLVFYGVFRLIKALGKSCAEAE